MKVLMINCPECKGQPLKIELKGHYYYMVSCLRCGQKYRIMKDDAEDKEIEHE